MEILNDNGEGSITACDKCRRAFRDEEPRIRAVRLHRATTFGGEQDAVEGLEADFHEACFPRDPARWRRLPD